MDFEFPLIPLLPLPITLVPASTFAALEDSKAQSQIQNAYVSTVSIGISSTATTASTPSPETLSEHERLGAIVDALGEASAKAQELPTSITQRQRLAKNPTQRVYILRTGLDSGEDQWLDQLRIGSPLMKEAIKKSLLDRNGPSQEPSEEDHDNIQEIAPMIQTKSRSEEKGVYVAGMLKIGEKKLFIVVEDVEPNQIAYDRPSPKLYQFLSKHFGLDRHLPQPNQFAIFEGYMLQDCGEPIMVDDQPYSSTSYSSSSSRSSPSKLSSDPNHQHHTNSSSSQTIPCSHSPSADNATLVHNNNFQNIKGPAPSRAQQPATILDGLENRPTSSTNPSTTTTATTTGSTNRRISSAFTSSINLSSPASNNTGNNSSGTPHPGTAPSLALASGGAGRTSRLLVSSIVFADS
ncbi:Alpha-tubulin N-acetyltransferase 1 [Podila minutissima]|uniref:Alpha-tubulin N-acetyltransferase 1 n=1 Tax=Podila minutissima TaxID=64525 RepID=A0A9P5VLS4_9FUNG|nr:Alpha-tubulin N-acetyltransferase 1 [Podila minutissima]